MGSTHILGEKPKNRFINRFFGLRSVFGRFELPETVLCGPKWGLRKKYRSIFPKVVFSQNTTCSQSARFQLSENIYMLGHLRPSKKVIGIFLPTQVVLVSFGRLYRARFHFSSSVVIKNQANKLSGL